MGFIFPRGGLWWLPPAFEYEVSDYKITSLLKKAARLHVDRPLDITEKKKDYGLPTFSREVEYNEADMDIQIMMEQYRDSIAAKMLDSIRKDNE